MINIDVDKVSNIILECVETVIMPHYQNLQDGDIEEKRPNDHVTIADKQSEEFLTKKLQELLPDSLVVGEEAVAADHSVLDRLKEDKPCWIIDPIDGTRHFIDGDRRWGVLLALSVNDKTQYGWIYDVIEKRMITIIKGEGVFVDGIKAEKKINESTDISELKIGYHGISLKIDGFRDKINSFKHSQINHCSVEHLSDFILGRSVDVLIGFGRGINVWDNAAGFLAAKELGCTILIDEGVEYKPSHWNKRFWIMAANKEAWQSVHDFLWPNAEIHIRENR